MSNKELKLTELTQEEYIKELELALLFVSDCYLQAKNSVCSCREGEGKADEKYADLWFHFPIIQGTGGWAVEKIASLRTNLGNRESNKISLTELFERLRKGRKTERELQDEVRDIVKKHNHE